MDKLNRKDYELYVDEKIPEPTYAKNMFFAFIIGGGICVLGQIIMNYLRKQGFNEDMVSTGASITLVFLSSLLTGLGIYDKIGKIGGAGATIPITGFANAIVAPAMEFKSEGFIFGVAANMFMIAGPVLVYGIGTSTIIALLSILFKK